MRFPVKPAWYPARNIVYSKPSLVTTPFLIIEPIYQKMRHLLGAGPLAGHGAWWQCVGLLGVSSSHWCVRSSTGRDNHANVEVPAPLRPRSSGWEPLRRGLRDQPEQHRAQSWAIALRSPASERSSAPNGIHQIYIYCREASVSFGTGGPLLDTSWTFCVVGGH